MLSAAWAKIAGMSRTVLTTLPRPLQRRLALGLQGMALLLTALHLFVRTLPATPTPIPAPGDPESAWWGLWPVTYAPGWAVILGSLLVLAVTIGSWRSLRSPTANRSMPRWALPGMAALLFLAFFLFPLAHTRWGDAYLLSQGIAWPDPAQRLVYSWQAPLDVFLHSRVWLWLHEPLGWADAMPAYRLLSPLAGGLYLLALLALSRDERLAPGWLAFGLLASLGLLQLFFGYVENYSFAAAGILLYLWLGVRVLQGRSPLWLAALALAVTNGLHPSTVVLAPSLLFLAWRRLGKNGGEPISFVTILAQVGLPMLLVAGGVILLMETGGHGIAALLTSDRPGGGDGRWLVPLFRTSTRWEHYTLFSWPHLRDFLNEQLLVAPAVLPALILLGGTGLWGRTRPEGELPSASARLNGTDEAAPGLLGFLGWAAGAHLLLTWLWNPDYGGQRDWDLFSLAAIPTALLLAVLAPRVLTERRLLRAGMAPLLLVQALHTAAWIYQNTRPWQWPS